MARKRYSDEDILKLLREIELKLADGADVRTACRAEGDVAFQTDAKFAEIRLGARLSLQPLQLGAQPLHQTRFQAEPCHCSCRVARSRSGITDSLTVLSEAGSNWSDTTVSFAVASLARLAFRIAGFHPFAP